MREEKSYRHVKIVFSAVVSVFIFDLFFHFGGVFAARRNLFEVFEISDFCRRVFEVFGGVV